jgi:hypothetical protein
MNEEPDVTNLVGFYPHNLRFYHLCDRCEFTESGTNNCPCLSLTMVETTFESIATTCTNSDDDATDSREKINTRK